MKITFPKVVLCCIVLNVILSLQSCSLFKTDPVEKYDFDPVCGMRVVKAEGFTSKFEGKNYYFDTYNCKGAFEMNPQKFIVKLDASKYAIDPVCGMQVIKVDGFVYKYKDTAFYFDQDKCMQTFIMNPEKFMVKKETDTKQ